MDTETLLRVGLVEGDPHEAARLARALGADAGLLLAFSVDRADARAALEHAAPDVLVVGLGAPHAPVLDLIRWVRRQRPGCEVMVVSSCVDDTTLFEAIAAGAHGYVLRNGPEELLPRQVRDLCAGGSPLDPLVARRLLRHWQACPAVPAREPAAAPLTAREREVLALVARGFRHEEVAERLGVSLATVRTHVRAVYAKLDVHNLAEAVFEARSQGWLA